VTPAEREHLLDRSYAAFNAGDTQAWPELWTEDLVWRMSGDAVWPGPREYVGYDGLERFREDWFGAWDEPTVRVVETEHLPDGDHTLLEARATGKAQGVEFELRVWQLVAFRDGRMATVDHFFDADAAREAAGLE
jgi:ketosteroid isomerase-like protein